METVAINNKHAARAISKEGSGKLTLTYRPDIDGLRAVAVVPVVLFHFNRTILPSGYIGVDIFFVISGFLITALLLREWSTTGTISLVGFWRRRVLRIAPALLVMVLVTFCIGQLVLFAADRFDLALNSSAALFSVANFTHWLNYGSYWGGAADSSPLLHTWSLSVEEQFYLLYPLALLLTLRFAKKMLPVAVVLVLVVSLVLYLWGCAVKPAATFYLLPTRAWELASGVLAAIFCFSRSATDSAKPLVSAVGMLLVIASYALIRVEGLSYFLWVPVLGSALVLAFSQGPKCVTTRMLSMPLLVGIGKISYSLYLWHWPAMMLSRAAGDRYGVQFPPLPLLSVLLLVSWASYRFVEVPIRKLPFLCRTLVAAMAMVAMATFGLRGVRSSEPMPYAPTEWLGNLYNVNPNKEWPNAIKRRMAGISVALSVPADDEYARAGIQRLYGGPTPEIMVFGDSHGLMWAPVLDAVAKSLGRSISFFTADGTPVFFKVPLDQAKPGTQFFSATQIRAFDKARLNTLRGVRPKLVVIAARWAGVEPAETQALLNEIRAVGAVVLLIEDPPYLAFGDRNAPQYLSYVGISADGELGSLPEQTADGEQAAKRFKRALAYCGDDCVPVFTRDLFDPRKGRSLVLKNNDVLYIDDDHVSTQGAFLAYERIRAALSDVFGAVR